MVRAGFHSLSGFLINEQRRSVTMDWVKGRTRFVCVNEADTARCLVTTAQPSRSNSWSLQSVGPGGILMGLQDFLPPWSRSDTKCSEDFKSWPMLVFNLYVVVWCLHSTHDASLENLWVPTCLDGCCRCETYRFMTWDISWSLVTYLSVSTPAEPALYRLKSSHRTLGCSAACLPPPEPAPCHLVPQAGDTATFQQFRLAWGLGASETCAAGNCRETKSRRVLGAGKSSATHRVSKWAKFKNEVWS